MSRWTPQERGLLVLVGKARGYDISCPCKTKCHCHHTKGGKKSQAGWGLCGGMYLLPAPPLWTPHVTAGHGRSSILRGAPGRAARAGRKAPPLPPPPRPHLGPAGGRPGQRLAPASLGRLPPHRGGRQLGCSPAKLCGRPEAIRLGGVVGVGPTQEGGVTGQGQASEFGLALPSLHCFSFIPVPGGRICERSRARRALYR